jgi:hypothetical protein
VTAVALPDLGKSKMSKLFRVCLCVGTLLLATNNVAESAGLRPELNGINEIYYIVDVDPPLGGDECKIEREKLNTGLQFVANQSTKLHIIGQGEYEQRAMELIDSNDLLGPDVEKRAAAAKRASDYGLKPRLHIGIYPITTAHGCSGHVEAKLSVKLKATTILPTGEFVSSPEMVVWSVTYGFIYPRQVFLEKVISIAEQEMKAFVNDWATSQWPRPSQ